METDIGQPIEYEPIIEPTAPTQPPHIEEDEQQRQQQYPDYMYHQHDAAYQPPQQMVDAAKKTFDLTSVDQNTMYLLFGAFIFGFIISKLTMQPIILKQ